MGGEASARGRLSRVRLAGLDRVDLQPYHRARPGLRAPLSDQPVRPVVQRSDGVESRQGESRRGYRRRLEVPDQPRRVRDPQCDPRRARGRALHHPYAFDGGQRRRLQEGRPALRQLLQRDPARSRRVPRFRRAHDGSVGAAAARREPRRESHTDPAQSRVARRRRGHSRRLHHVLDAAAGLRNPGGHRRDGGRQSADHAAVLRRRRSATGCSGRATSRARWHSTGFCAAPGSVTTTSRRAR